MAEWVAIAGALLSIAAALGSLLSVARMRRELARLEHVLQTKSGSLTDEPDVEDPDRSGHAAVDVDADPDEEDR